MKREINKSSKALKSVKKAVLKVFNKMGYRLIRNEFSGPLTESEKLCVLQYKALIKEAEGLYREFLFPDLTPCDEKELELMADLLGTQISEAVYIKYFLSKAAHLEGDVCEFGVAQGATSAFMANRIKDIEKNIWLFDSFEGLSKPSEKDRLKNDIFKLGSIDAYEGMMASGKELVQKRLRDINFPASRIKIIPGFIEQSIKARNLPEKVCFAYVDFDFYEPIKVALQFLHKTLQENGFIIIDDYDYFSTGAKTAVDEFMEVHRDQYKFSLPIESAGHFCILRKTSTASR